MSGKANLKALCVMVIGFSCSCLVYTFGPSELMANNPIAALVLLIIALAVYSILGED